MTCWVGADCSTGVTTGVTGVDEELPIAKKKVYRGRKAIVCQKFGERKRFRFVHQMLERRKGRSFS